MLVFLPIAAVVYYILFLCAFICKRMQEIISYVFLLEYISGFSCNSVENFLMILSLLSNFWTSGMDHKICLLDSDYLPQFLLHNL